MKKNTRAILQDLKKMHGEPRCELNYANALELTVATVLSAQCTDERVNRVTKDLFKKYKEWQDYIDTQAEELQEDIKPTGFYRNKTKSLKNIAGEILHRFDGRVPDDIDTFATVKGIGRKSANLIIGIIYNKPAVVVDRHVIRVSGRVGFTKNTDPAKIETDIKKIVPEESRTAFSFLMTLHGRYICKARKPDCPRCLLHSCCDYYTGGKKDV